MKKFLTDLIERKKSELKSLKERSDASENLDEVRAIGTQIESVNAEIAEAERQLAEVEAKEQRDAGNQFEPNKTLETVKMNRKAGAEEKSDDPLATMEYRTAFMNYVQRGEMSDILRKAERRDAQQTQSKDLGIMIPSTVIQKIITDVEKVYGQLYSRVRKTNIQGGVKYPIGSFNATFKRITETTVSDRQKGGEIKGAIEFSYNIGEIRIAQTLLANVLSVPAFENELSKVIVKAYVKAMDNEIMNGDSENNEFQGIITEAKKGGGGRIPTDNIITFTAEEMLDWTTWQKKLFAKIPLSMRALRPEFVMTASTYEANIKTLKDDNNRPVYNETFNPVDGAEISKFKGKDVVFVEDDILKDFDAAANEEFFGMYWVPSEAYAINTNMEFYVKRYFDDEKNEYVDKALVINDGKPLDTNYIYLLQKKIDG